ncbi:MAG: hypothetical protein CM1200mP39_19680 [Dehalococcoidia bacterium]|nr:MAG: hypothetical protein CM1200mP39_19680 [Dehalococcoidia bacterium]
MSIYALKIVEDVNQIGEAITKGFHEEKCF